MNEDAPIDYAQLAASLGFNEEREASTFWEEQMYQRWCQQAVVLSTHFAKVLGMSSVDYIKRLPRFEASLNQNMPILVQPPQGPLTLEVMLDQLGIAEDRWRRPKTDLDSIKDWSEDSFHTPDRPYIASIIDKGFLNICQPFNEVRDSLGSDQRAGSIFEVLAVNLLDPAPMPSYNLNPLAPVENIIARIHQIPAQLAAPGSEYPNSMVPGLNYVSGSQSLVLYPAPPADAERSWGSLIMAREINF